MDICLCPYCKKKEHRTTNSSPIGGLIHDENREVQLLVKEVLSGSVQFYDNPNGAYEWTCPYCCGKLEGGHETLLKGVCMDDLQHDHDCAYIIAKGLTTAST